MKLRIRLLLIIIATLCVLAMAYTMFIIPEFEIGVTEELVDELEVQISILISI